MVKKKTFFSGIRFAVKTANSNLLDDAITCYIFGGYKSPGCLYTPWNFYQGLCEVLHMVLGIVDDESGSPTYTISLVGVRNDFVVGKVDDLLQRLV